MALSVQMVHVCVGQTTWSLEVGSDAGELESLHLSQVDTRRQCMGQVVELEQLAVEVVQGVEL